jgi:hypothetical protein
MEKEHTNQFFNVANQNFETDCKNCRYHKRMFYSRTWNWIAIYEGSHARIIWDEQKLNNIDLIDCPACKIVIREMIKKSED